jgi:hypothetical protein
MAVTWADVVQASENGQSLWYLNRHQVPQASPLAAADETGVAFDDGQRRSLQAVFLTEAEAMATVLA